MRHGTGTGLEAQLTRPPGNTDTLADNRVDASLPLYARHFGLSRAPFSIAPDPRYLYMSERHREALAHLLFGLQGGGGFVLLTGEIGSGKTTVCRCMLEQVPEHCNVAYIFNPRLTAGELLETVCDEFHIPRNNTGSTLKSRVDALNDWLLANHARGRISVLVIDEAQSLSPEVLEQLRLLTNLETNERKLLQIVLVGQPELRAMVAGPGLEQLAQRVIARYHLEALSSEDTVRYIRHRLSVAGLRGPLPFDRRALRRVMYYARGVARRINLLCDRALLGAYAEGKGTVTARVVDTAAQETFDTAPAKSNWLRIVAGLGATALAAALVALAGLQERDATSPPIAPASIQAASAPVTPSPSPTHAPVTVTPPKPSPSSMPGTPHGIKPEELQELFGSTDSSEAAVLRQLGALWNVTLSDTEPCRTPAGGDIQCFRDSASNLVRIRQLGRPGVLTLYDNSNRSFAAPLIGLSEHNATLRASDGTVHTVTLASLAPLWRGTFTTLWRAPEGYRAGLGDVESGPGANALAAHLSDLAGKQPAAANQPQETGLASAIVAFQLAQGLRPDGKAGPLTLMKLNPLIGVREPRLETAP